MSPELDELCHEIDGSRLLTLVGTGGIGKMRLVMEIVERIGGSYADGVFVVDLSPIAQPEPVVQAAAQALGLRTELDRQPQMAILTYLRTRQLLLVLDNCEHLVDACGEVVQAVLQHCPEVRVMATSREPLGLPGEHLYRLGPLEEDAAVRLFVERARAQRTGSPSAAAWSYHARCRAARRPVQGYGHQAAPLTGGGGGGRICEARCCATW